MKNPLAAILLGGLAAGALDIIYAFVVYGPLSFGMTPVQVLQSVAAGWYGRKASMSGGTPSALVGLCTHFFIATTMAAVFVLAAGRIRAFSRAPILWGFAYGLILYVVMNYVVAPLSAAGPAGHFAASGGEVSERLTRAFSKFRPDDPVHPWMLPATIFTHTVLVGIPIALINARFNPPLD